MKKTVLLMIDSLTCGGAEKSLVSLLPLLDYSKIDVTLMLVGRGGIFEQYVPDQVKIIDYTHGCRTLFQKIWLYICRLSFSMSLRLNKFLKHPYNSPTLEWITCHTAIQKHLTHYDVAIAYQQGFPCWYVMDKVSADKKYAWINVDITKTRFRFDYVKKYYNQYDGVVAVSDALYEILLNIKLVNKERLYCVYDILNTDLIRKQGNEDFGGERPRNNYTTIVTTARLNSRNKGQDMCINAARILKEKGYVFQWFLVGDGPDRQTLEQQARDLDVNDDVRFVGMQPNPYPYIKAADIYVQSSRYEGFGLTVTEAKILGRAIVCTNFPTAFNQLEDGKNGLIVEMTSEAIAAGVERLLTNSTLANKLRLVVSKEENTTAATESRKVMDLIMA